MPEPENENVTFVRVRTGVYAEQGLTVAPFYLRHYGQLIGRRIAEIRFEKFEHSTEPLPCLVFDDASSAAVLCDPEGNGPGHLECMPPSHG